MTARTTLTVKLTPGKDDDLINWLTSIPKGQRQALVKSLLRDAIQEDCGELSIGRRLVQIGQDTTWLRTALTELPTWMEDLLVHLAIAPAPEATGSDARRKR